MAPLIPSMNLCGAIRGFYEIEMGFYDIGTRVYEIDQRVYEMVPSEEGVLLLRHCPPTADVEPVRGSLLRDLDQTLVTQYLASAHENTPRLPPC